MANKFADQGVWSSLKSGFVGGIEAATFVPAVGGQVIHDNKANAYVIATRGVHALTKAGVVAVALLDKGTQSMANAAMDDNQQFATEEWINLDGDDLFMRIRLGKKDLTDADKKLLTYSK